MADERPDLKPYDIARVLKEIATLLEIAGANEFEIMAYRNGADTVDEWPGDLNEAVDNETLTDLPGIGKGLARVITELVKTGESSDHKELKGQFPPGLPAVLKVPGLGPKKIKALFEQLNIGSLEDLQSAASEGRISALKGFGKKSEEKILEGIPIARKRLERDKEKGLL